jgi:hypothetical protein
LRDVFVGMSQKRITHMAHSCESRLDRPNDCCESLIEALRESSSAHLSGLIAALLGLRIVRAVRSAPFRPPHTVQEPISTTLYLTVDGKQSLSQCLAAYLSHNPTSAVLKASVLDFPRFFSVRHVIAFRFR